jgi:mRNA-degrading endonuclease toxin of MazEF toxin-antitoxin module
VGREQQGIRPTLVVSNQHYNTTPHSLCIVAPITGTHRGVPSHYPVDPPEGGLSKTSVVLCEQVRALSLLRFRRKRGEVTIETLEAVQRIIGMFIDRP